jgi:hypothetical protein
MGAVLITAVVFAVCAMMVLTSEAFFGVSTQGVNTSTTYKIEQLCKMDFITVCTDIGQMPVKWNDKNIVAEPGATPKSCSDFINCTCVGNGTGFNATFKAICS